MSSGSIQTKTKKRSFLAENMAKSIVSKSVKKVICIEEKTKLKSLNEQMKEQQKIVSKCVRNDYKYGKTNISLMKLLGIILSENKKRVIDFIELFPFSGLKGGSTVNQSLIFEALWVIIFLCSFDDLRKKNFKRIFKKRLEDPVSKSDNRSLDEKLNNTNVSESHSSGIADIYFEENIAD